MAQVFKDADGNYVALKSDGTQVPMLPTNIGNASVGGFAPVSQTQGVTLGQRFVVKNLASNPDAAKAYLDAQGYEVRAYGGGFNFAVRPKNGGPRVPWKVVDPDGFDSQDLLDFAGDALSLGLQATTAAVVSPAMAAGPAGLAVEAGAVGGVSAGVEAGRQALGSMAGVPGNINPKQIGLAGAAGAVGTGVGRVVGKAASAAGRFIGKTARAAGAKFAGIEGSQALSGADALLDAAEWGVDHPKQLMRTPEQAGVIMRDAVKKIAAEPFPEKELALDMARSAANDMGATVNLRPHIEALQSELYMPVSKGGPYTGPGSAWHSTAELLAEPIPELGGPKPTMARTPELEAKHGIESSLNANLEKTLATVYNILRDDAPLSAVPTDRAVLIKNYLQGLGMQKGAFTQNPPGRVFRDLIANAAHGVRDAVEKEMTTTGFTDYVPTMRAFELKTKLLHDWSKALRVKGTSAADSAARTAFVRNLYSDSKTAYLSALDDLETSFGVTGLKAVAREARAGTVTGASSPEGPSLLGKGMRSTMGLGALAFGHPGVAAAELAATSPRAVLGAAKAGVRASRMLGPALKGGVKGGSLLVAQQAARLVGKGIARNDAAPTAPRSGGRPTRIGI